MFKKLLSVLMLAIISNTCWASDTNNHETENHHTSHHESKVESPHSLGIFLGGVQTEHHTYSSYGLEYAYEFNHKWATSVAWEKVDGAHHGDGIETFVVSALYSPMEKVGVGAGYGKERIHGHDGGKEDLYRLSAAYDFHIDHFKIAPMVAVDFVEGETSLVVGTSFGITF